MCKAGFETGTQDLIRIRCQTPNPLGAASHYFNEVLCANSNFTEKFEQKVDGTVLGRLYSPILTYPVK